MSKQIRNRTDADKLITPATRNQLARAADVLEPLAKLLPTLSDDLMTALRQRDPQFFAELARLKSLTETL